MLKQRCLTGVILFLTILMVTTSCTIHLGNRPPQKPEPHEPAVQPLPPGGPEIGPEPHAPELGPAPHEPEIGPEPQPPWVSHDPCPGLLDEEELEPPPGGFK